MNYAIKLGILTEANEDALLADGFEEALIGVCYRAGHPAVACYDISKCIEILMGQGMSDEEAIEYFEFNVIGAWVGDSTPVFVDRFVEVEYLI
jgi:hypothetical protein